MPLSSSIISIKPLNGAAGRFGPGRGLSRPGRDWFAAAFHCGPVLKSRPDDAAAKALLDKARKQWAAHKAAEAMKP
jgi:hypothetical protein